MPKELCVTTDYIDNLRRAKRHFEARHIEALMEYSAALGATRHEWLFNTAWALYDEGAFCGFDALAAACKAAHRRGMRLDVVYKPFEGVNSQAAAALPHTAPRPEGAPVFDELTGLVHAIRPFVAEHPEMRLRLHPEDARDPGGRIAAARLVKRDEAPAPFGLEDLSLWTSPRNGGFARYRGPVNMRDAVEWRLMFPYRDEGCRVLELGGLELPEDTRFVLVRREGRGGGAPFVNRLDRLVELVNERGEVLPSSAGCRRLDPDALHKRMRLAALLGFSPLLRHPEARAFAMDRERFVAEAEGMFSMAERPGEVDFGRVGEVAVARGRPLHSFGALNPVYPEVRRHWLDEVQHCIERGADGVNFRLANHSHWHGARYGFNEPTLARSQTPGDIAEARRINGEAFTQFLREARDLLHRNGREIGVHIHAEHFRHNELKPDGEAFPRNFDWQWEVWIREIADYCEFRGAQQLRPDSLREVVDRIGLAAREAGIPFVYQSIRGTPVRFDGPYPTLEWEMDWIRRHPNVSVYNLYESADVVRLNEAGDAEGSRDMAELARRRWWR